MAAPLLKINQSHPSANQKINWKPEQPPFLSSHLSSFWIGRKGFRCKRGQIKYARFFSSFLINGQRPLRGDILFLLHRAPQRLETFAAVEACVCVAVYFSLFRRTKHQGGLRCVSGSQPQIMEAEKVIILALSRVPGCVRGLINVLIPTYFKCTFSGRNMPFPRDPQTHITLPTAP
jgi:hypothetical protein